MENCIKSCWQCKVALSKQQHWKRKIKFCSRKCAAQYYRYDYREKNKKNTIPRGTVGAILELQVSVDLMLKGKNVFRALSPNCPCDLAVLDDGKLKTIEVRTGYKTQSDDIKWSDKGSADIWAVGVGDNIYYFNKDKERIL